MKSLQIFGKEMVLGALIAILSVFTAFVSLQGSTADSKQNESEILGMQSLNDGNAEYLSANQFIVYDFTMFDGWYTTDDEAKAEYYESSYSDELIAAIEANPEDPFSEDYYNAMYASANELWEESDAAFETASEWDNRGDSLQLVILFTALGLAFSAWASLLKEESNLRPLFGFAAAAMLIVGLVFYLGAPVVG
ncbi:MAG: hypothetical protein HY867_12325 [Chloroflexi bacterium]|nr:hypothetical protein [Chloroflexota bacterium]